MFDRDGNGEFNSKELTMLQDYLQMYGKEKDIKIPITSPVNTTKKVKLIENPSKKQITSPC